VLQTRDRSRWRNVKLCVADTW